jgi:cyclase
MIRRTRVIPVLLIHKGAVYKTIKFNSPQYIGDPKNAIRLFNDLEVDEIVILDIDASKKNNSPNIQLIKELASEAFMPFSYGGGIKNIKHVKNILKCGVEKVILNHSIIQDVTLLKSISNEIGSSGVVAAVDYLNKWGNRQFLFDHVTKKKYRINMLEHIKKLQNYGAGEIILNCVNNDGLMDGLDIETLKQIHESSDVPLIACGGAGTISNLKDAESAGASGIAAGSMFVYFGKQKGILINYPKETSLRDNLR